MQALIKVLKKMFNSKKFLFLVKTFIKLKELLNIFLILVFSFFVTLPYTINIYADIKIFLQKRFSILNHFAAVFHYTLMYLLILSLTIIIVKYIFRSYMIIYNKYLMLTKFVNRYDEEAVRELVKEIKKNKVIMLTGIWGCGKTTLYREVLYYKLAASSNFISYKFVYISCFGIKSEDDLIVQILNKINFVEFFCLISKFFIQILESSTHFKRNLISRRNFIVIDDFERMENDCYKEVFGLIDFLHEQKQCRILLICNEEKMSSPTYKEIKEKIVDKTLNCPLSSELLSVLIEKKLPSSANNILKEFAQKIVSVHYNLRCFSRALSAFKDLDEKIEMSIEESKHTCFKEIFNLVWDDIQNMSLLLFYIEALGLLENAKVAKSQIDLIVAECTTKEKNKGKEQLVEKKSGVLSRLFLLIGADFKYHNSSSNPPNDVPKWFRNYIEEKRLSWEEFYSDQRVLTACHIYINSKISEFEKYKLYGFVEKVVRFIFISDKCYKSDSVWNIYFLYLSLKKILFNCSKLIDYFPEKYIENGNNLSDYYLYFQAPPTLTQQALEKFIDTSEQREIITQLIKNELNAYSHLKNTL